MRDLADEMRERIAVLEERVRQLEAALVPDAHMPPIEWGLTASEARVYAVLQSREQASKAAIMAALYGIRPDDGADPKIIDVFICKLRRKLRPFGKVIETIWGFGYAMKGERA